MSKPLVPFGWLPGHWGLRGDTRELARIDYEVEDLYEREVQKANVNLYGETLEAELLAIKLRHNKMSKHEYDMKRIDSIEDDDKRQLATLACLLEAGDISEREYDKEVHTVHGMPWYHFDAEYVDGALDISVDWNQAYIEYLKASGYGSYASATDEEIIDEYVRDLGRKLCEEDVSEDYRDELGHRFVEATPNDDGTTDYG